MTMTMTRTSDRINYLDGIRGWASIMVLFSHLLYQFLIHTMPFLLFDRVYIFKKLSNYNLILPALNLFLKFMSDGHLAVLIFFILSGYALSAGHLSLVNANKKLPMSAAARYFRLMMPILATTLIVYVILKLNLMFNRDVSREQNVFAHWLGSFYNFDANIKNALQFSFYDVFFNYNSSRTYNSSLWTMHIEIMGSFIIYAYLGIFRRTEHIHWQVVVLITTILFCAYPFYACFFIGYIIAELHKKYNIHTSMQKIGVNKNKVEIIVILSFVALAILSTHFRANDYVICLLGAGIVIFASLSNIMKTFFENRVSTFLGKISFPLYLIHVPVICSWSSYLYLKLPECGVGLLTAGLINFFSTVLFCLILATLLTPIEKISVKYSKKIAEMLLYFPLRKTSQFANLGYSSELQK